MTTPRTCSCPPSLLRVALIVAVGLVLGATAFTVRSFVQSTGDESSGPVRPPGVTRTGGKLCIELPFELTFATERHEHLVGIGALRWPCEPRPASAEG